MIVKRKPWDWFPEEGRASARRQRPPASPASSIASQQRPPATACGRLLRSLLLPPIPTTSDRQRQELELCFWGKGRGKVDRVSNFLYLFFFSSVNRGASLIRGNLKKKSKNFSTCILENGFSNLYKILSNLKWKKDYFFQTLRGRRIRTRVARVILALFRNCKQTAVAYLSPCNCMRNTAWIKHWVTAIHGHAPSHPT